jgi:hypothetical protein
MTNFEMVTICHIMKAMFWCIIVKMANIKLIHEIIYICSECLLGTPIHSITHQKNYNQCLFYMIFSVEY